MTLPTYSAARGAADQIHRHLERLPSRPGGDKTSWPDADTLAVLIDAAFWTSLRREEIYTPRISLAFAAPSHVKQAISFAIPLLPSPKDLAKLAAAVERSGIHLCVFPESGELQVWGITRQLPPQSLVIEIIVPGLLVIKLSPGPESGKFLNVAVLQGDQIKIIDPYASAAPKGSAMDSLLRPELSPDGGTGVNVLLQLALSTRAHGRGGLLLVVPEDSDSWKKSVVHPITYEVSPPFPGLANLIRKGDGVSRSWEDAMARAVDGIAGLTAVDGATVITTDYRVLVFGAKIVRRTGSPQVSEVVVTESVEGGHAVTAEPVQLGGTRHLAAAQFVHDQRDAIAMVASQDGRFTVFGWSAEEEKVHAHRIDVLLL
ncbi:MAG: putative sensor domain DACNV-containing protein [Acidobacteriota bacterium]